MLARDSQYTGRQVRWPEPINPVDEKEDMGAVPMSSPFSAEAKGSTAEPIRGKCKTGEA